MADVKGKHPSWFKMKLERRELVRQLSPETAVNVLLACWDYLETGEKPLGLSPIENVAFSSFMPDMDEAWSRYIQRITAKSNRTTSTDIDRPHTTSTETEEETEVEEDSISPKGDMRKSGADKPPRRLRFVPPTVEQVAEYVRSRGSSVDPQGFIDFYEAKGWMIGKTPMKDWKSACRNAESWERWKKPAQPQPPQPRRTGRLDVDENGEEVVRFD